MNYTCHLWCASFCVVGVCRDKGAKFAILPSGAFGIMSLSSFIVFPNLVETKCLMIKVKFEISQLVK